jgi:hypothetical protein
MKLDALGPAFDDQNSLGERSELRAPVTKTIEPAGLIALEKAAVVADENGLSPFHICGHIYATSQG